MPIGSIVIDDAHACLETTEGQFTMKADGLFRDRMLQLFREDLRLQSEAKLADITTGQSNSQALVPFWAWSDKQSQVFALLSEIDTARRTPARQGDFTEETYSSLRFNYPLIKQSLGLCRCVITGTEVEISPRIIPIDVIPCFGNAARRIVMSATLADNSVLVSHFNFSPDSITKSITPTLANDIGDRMILIPQELNPEFGDDTLKAFFEGLAAKRNVVVIVPSKYRSQYWQDVAAMTLKAESLEEGIEKMKGGHVGLVVLINKYDGIDLPKKACEVLVIDGLPDVRREIDKIEESVLYGTEQILSQRIQRIEQGMGRGVRSNDDYCLVFLVGKTLTNFLYKAGAAQKFSSATRAQFALSEQLSDELHGKQIAALKEVSESNGA
ncbi:MAG TPA: helicase C-terminal domain-containing protein [Verrucomicrobiae bacterium]|nr:helicase C-terminal domain-containing protein [Verrucomicrobiae bacterium]